MSRHYSSWSEVAEGAARSRPPSVQATRDASHGASGNQLGILPRRLSSRVFCAAMDVFGYRWEWVVKRPLDRHVLTRVFMTCHRARQTGFVASLRELSSGWAHGFPPLKMSRSRLSQSFQLLRNLGLIHTTPVRGGLLIVFDYERFFTEEHVDGFPPDVVTMQMVRRKNGIRPAQSLW